MTERVIRCLVLIGLLSLPPAVGEANDSVTVRILTGSHTIQVTTLTFTIPGMGMVSVSPLPPVQGPGDSTFGFYAVADTPTAVSMPFLMDGVGHSFSANPLRYDTLYTLPFHGSPDSKIMFRVRHPDNPPVLAAIGSKNVMEGQMLQFVVTATDPDPSPTLILSALNRPPNAAFVDSGNGHGLFTFNPDFNQAGMHPVLFVVSDGQKADSEQVTIQVQDVDRPPVLAATGLQTVAEGQVLQVPISASDPDAEPLALIAQNLPVHATLTDSGGGRGLLRFAPDFDQAGPYQVTIIARETRAIGPLADTGAVNINVTNTNRPPVLAAIGPQAIAEDDTLLFAVNALDPDGQSVTLAAFNLPPNALFVDSLNGRGSFRFTPDTTQQGVYDVLFTATDGTASDSQTVSISVCDISAAPVLADVNCDGVVDITDIVFLINYVVFGAPAPVRAGTADVNCDLVVDLVDIIATIQNVVFGTPFTGCP